MPTREKFFFILLFRLAPFPLAVMQSIPEVSMAPMVDNPVRSVIPGNFAFEMAIFGVSDGALQRHPCRESG
jgi:hypothetical protein